MTLPATVRTDRRPGAIRTLHSGAVTRGAGIFTPCHDRGSSQRSQSRSQSCTVVRRGRFRRQLRRVCARCCREAAAAFMVSWTGPACDLFGDALSPHRRVTSSDRVAASAPVSGECVRHATAHGRRYEGGRTLGRSAADSTANGSCGGGIRTAVSCLSLFQAVEFQILRIYFVRCVQSYRRLSKVSR